MVVSAKSMAAEPPALTSASNVDWADFAGALGADLAFAFALGGPPGASPGASAIGASEAVMATLYLPGVSP